MVYRTMTTETERHEPQAAPAAERTAAIFDGAPAKTHPVLTKVSIVIPVYNEEATIQYLVSLVVAAPMPTGLAREIIIVNDCSTDGTAAKLDQLQTLFPSVEIRVFHKPVNQGKG